ADTFERIRRVRSPSVANIPVPKSRPSVTSKSSAAPPQQPYAVLEVELPTDIRLATIRLEVHTPQGWQKEQQESLGLKQRNVNDLIKASQKLKKTLSEKLGDEEEWKRYAKRWEADYRKLADQVTKLLWPTYFGFLYGRAYQTGSGNVRLRFNLEG